MFAKLFALFFGKKEEPEQTLTFKQRLDQTADRREQRYAQPLRTGKARSSSSVNSSARREDDIMSNPIHPLNPLSPVYYDSAPNHTPSSYDCGSSSSSSYDSSSSSSCDSGSSSSGGGD